MNTNELKALLTSIQDQIAEIEAQHEAAVEAGNWEAVQILNDNFENLDNRESDIKERIKYANPLMQRGAWSTADQLGAGA